MIIDAKLENLSVILDKIRSVAEDDCPYQKKLCLVAEEIFVNITSYAYIEEKREDRRVVEFRCKKENGIVEMMFCDYGIPFDPLKQEKKQSIDDLEEQETGGFGIVFVKEVMDEIAYERKEEANVLIMKKCICNKVKW